VHSQFLRLEEFLRFLKRTDCIRHEWAAHFPSNVRSIAYLSILQLFDGRYLQSQKECGIMGEVILNLWLIESNKV